MIVKMASGEKFGTLMESISVEYDSANPADVEEARYLLEMYTGMEETETAESPQTERDGYPCHFDGRTVKPIIEVGDRITIGDLLNPKKNAERKKESNGNGDAEQKRIRKVVQILHELMEAAEALNDDGK